MLKKPYVDTSFAENYFISLYGEKTDFQRNRYKNAFENFKKTFNVESAYVASSSGRVEVCGNHTDHNGGKVLSCAISLDTLAMFLPSNENVIYIKSEGYPDIKVNLADDDFEEKGTSSALVKGVVVAMKNKGYKVGGFFATFTSNVLGGAGISSSASFEVLVAEILNFLYNDGKISPHEKAVIAQYSENVYFGKPCGLLDQTAIAFGGLKKLDFSDKTKINVTEIDNSLSDYTLILINTGGSHANLTDEYASIPSEMFSVAKAMGKERLVDVDKNYFFSSISNFKNKVSDRAVLRAIHFYQENERVDKACDALSSNDYDLFLTAVKESGISSLNKLQNCYVSGSLDQAIPKALAISNEFLNGGVNRVHGGGFAGSILNIVKNENVDDFIKGVSAFFNKDCIIPLRVRSVGTIVL
ncbi:MAG: galactokinase [Clostridiales bacterium]|nr:galactokinase [Clostridiales bacterium]